MKKFLSASGLVSEKVKDYKRIVIIQSVIVVAGLTLQDTSEIIFTGNIKPFIQSVFFLFGAAYLFLMWDLFRNFTSNKIVIKGVLLTMIFIFLLGSIVQNPFFTVTDHPRPYLFIIHATLLAIEILIISHAIRDIFSATQITNDNLWGAASVYFMIAISFGSLYDFLNIIQPGCFGVFIPLGFESYSESIYHSLCIIGGMSSVYSNPSHLVRNVSVIEAVWGGLYVVLLIGRIIGKSSEK